MFNFLKSNGISVFTDKPFYAAGGVVNGYVLLNCLKSFDCQQVVLKVEGYEKVSWEEEHTTHDTDTNESSTAYTPYTGSHEFFKIMVPLQQWPQYCQPGQYQFPFSFVLPVGIPGSFLHTDSQHFYGGVTYKYTKAKVRFVVKAACMSHGRISCKGKSRLTVHQTLQKPPSEIQSSHTQSVTTCCCSSAGSCSVTASVQKDSYCPGETACVLLQVENNSTAEFKSVEVALRRRLTLTGGGSVQQLDDEVVKQSFEGLGANTSFVGKAARLLQLALPTTLLPSTLGQVVQCDYSLVVTLRAHTFVSNVVLKLPLLIYMPIPSDPVYPQPPDWWTATQVLPPTQLQLPSAPPMAPQAQQMAAPGSVPYYSPPQPTYGGPPQ